MNVIQIKNSVNDLKNTAQPNIENFQFYINNNIDNYLALQHCTLYNPHITQDRYFEVTIIDSWDFDYRKQKNKKDFREYLSNDINNWGYSMQEKNRMENYYVIYHIKEKI